MHSEPLLSGADTLLFMVPFLVMMLFVMFRLDEHFAAPKAAHSSGSRRADRHRFCEVTREGETLICDPDGKPLNRNLR